MKCFSAKTLFCVLQACLLTLLALSTQSAFALAPALDSTRLNPNRVVNEVYLQLIPDQYLSIPQANPAPIGAWIKQLLLMRVSGSTATTLETIQLGDKFSDRRLIGSWSGSFNTFRYLQKPDAVPPRNMAGGILLRPSAQTTHLDIAANDLSNFGSQYPHTHLTVLANGITQGAVTMQTGWTVPNYRVQLSLQDSFWFQIQGSGSATINSLYLYNSTTPIKSLEGLAVSVPAGGAWVSHASPYYGLATDCALRVQASGVTSASRLVMKNAAGAIIMSWPLATGANVLTSEESDVLRRNLNSSQVFPASQLPTPASSRVIWSQDMKVIPTDWTAPNATTSLYSDGEKLVMEGKTVAGSGHYLLINLPTEFDFETYPYLQMRVRASLKTSYFIRLTYNGTPATPTNVVTALEARSGLGTDAENGWELLTLNLRTLQRIYNPASRKINQIVLVTAPDPASPPPDNTVLRMEVDWMGFNCGLTPGSYNPASNETNFTNGLDDDGDGLVDRDDENFRNMFPVSVLTNYQTVVQSMTRGGFGGNRLPGDGNAGPAYYVDPTKFSPVNPTKRLTLCTYYPLDYRTNPAYAAPSNYDEFWGRSANGIFNSCLSLNLPPTEQFPTLDYGRLGALEEYNTRDSGWVGAQVNLARSYGLDGFIYNDCGLNPAAYDEMAVQAMTRYIQGQAQGAWHEKPFLFAPFYNMMPSDTLRKSVNEMILDLAYVIKYRASSVSSQMKFRGKPMVFIYPNDRTSAGPSPFSVSQWNQIFAGLMQLPSYNFDSAMSIPSAVPGDANTLSFTFDRWRTDIGGAPLPAQMNFIEWLDKDMRLIKKVQFGTAEARALLLEGWGGDVASAPPLDHPFTTIQQYDRTATPGFARMRMNIPKDACYMKMSMLGWGNDAVVGSVQQYCELRVNTSGGTAAVRFPTHLGWWSYVFRLRNLAAGFDMSGVADQQLTELPVSFWGDIPELVARLDQAHRSQGFDGSASYGSSVRDVRVEVSYPYLTAATVRPGFDNSGCRYYCTTPPASFRPHDKGRFYRKEWEQVLQNGADMAIVTSWNEYLEGTNIEPDIEHGFDPLRLTLTYSLMLKGVVETAKLPSTTDFTLLRYDQDGQNRTIQFYVAGPETIKFNKTKFGLNGSLITAITRTNTAVAVNSAEAQVQPNTETPTLTINAPAGGNVYTITYNAPVYVVPQRTDQFNSAATIQTAGSSTGWSSMGFNTPGFASLEYDTTHQALKAMVSSSTDKFRVAGAMANQSEWLPYSSIGTGTYVRAKYYVFATPQSPTAALNTLPNLRLRLSNRFAVNSILEIFGHSNDSSSQQSLEQEVRPSTDPDRPSLYRVDFDPIDVPYLISNAATEGVQRGFEAYALYPQDAGSISLTESVLGTYSTQLVPDTATPVKIYRTSASDAGDLKLFNSLTELSITNLIPSTVTGGYSARDTAATPSQLCTYSEGPGGVTLDSRNVPTNRLGILTREFNRDANTQNYASHVRVEENKQYKIRWHITSTQQTNRQAQLRLRARSVKFSWTQKLELGGSWATGGTQYPLSANNAIAQQILPGVGCQNPDRNTGDNGGWYTMFMHSPLNTDVRPEFTMGTPLSVRMPNLVKQPGPGVNLPSVRDLALGVDLVDTFSSGAGKDQEAGNFTIDRIEVRAFGLVND